MDFVINAQFQDFDLFASEAKAWELDLVQLDRGRPSFDLLLATIDQVQITRARFSRKLYQQGATPRWGRTFVNPMNPEQDLQWFGYRVTGNDLLIFPDNGELPSATLSRCH